ncbi:FecR family protein [Mariniphaga sediminis]|uniref:FecR family protein n=1 Tax=Mariniphaga sediminis TaxID=1628158 RepID=UPI003561E69D
MDKGLLKKYVNNSCTEKEFDELVRRIINDFGNNQWESWSFDEWKSFEPDLKTKDEKKYSDLLNRIHHEINLRNKSHKEKKVVTLRMVTTWFSRAAAILFIPLLGFLLYMISTRDIESFKSVDLTVDSLEIIAPIGSRAVIQLSDGTEVNLNYGSKIKYPRTFEGDIRGVTLEGEGYFDVAHNPDKPFVVKTGKINVKALGTKFNVNAYPDDHEIATTLVEGKVVVEKTKNGENLEPLGIMVPGQHIVYDTKSEKISSSSKGSVHKYIGWTEGKLVFDNEPITEVAEKLSRMFNVDIEISDNIKDLTYTVTFINDPLFFILDLMKETTPVTYKTFQREKLPDGTYTKQKIRIMKRQ